MTVASEKVQFIHIKEGSVGYSYANFFGKCLDGNLEWIEVEDPYIRARHQVSLSCFFLSLRFVPGVLLLKT